MPQDNVVLTNHRWAFIPRNIPNLQSTPMTQGAAQIAWELGQLASKQCQAHIEVDQRRQHDADKKPSNLCGTNMM
jgi:hypothetical protein